jgi:hypothetical protein
MKIDSPLTIGVPWARSRLRLPVSETIAAKLGGPYYVVDDAEIEK